MLSLPASLQVGFSVAVLVGAAPYNGAQAPHCGAPRWGASFVAEHGLYGAGSGVVAHRISRSTACGIFLDQRSNPCALHWQADSSPLSHQGSP